MAMGQNRLSKGLLGRVSKVGTPLKLPGLHKMWDESRCRLLRADITEQSPILIYYIFENSVSPISKLLNSYLVVNRFAIQIH